MFSRHKSMLPPEVAALLQALNLREQTSMPLRNLTDVQWKSLLQFCDTSHLTLPLARLPVETFPIWVKDRLKLNQADNAARYLAIQSAYREVAAALHSAGVEHIVLKGFTQAPDYVPQPEQRSQSDLDLFCPPSQIAAAQTALETIGYASASKYHAQAADHGPALVRLGEWQWRGNRFDPEMPLGVELHFCLWNQRVSRLSIPEVGMFWRRRVQRTLGDLSFPCLGAEDHLGYISLHILRNIFLRDWIVHHVRELAVFLHSRADDHTFWTRWSGQHSPSLRSLEAIAFYHAQAWFGCNLHPSAQDEIDRLPHSHAIWLERFSGAALENMFRQNKDELWLHLSLLSSFKDKWYVFRRTLIPPRIADWNAPVVEIRNKRLIAPGSNHLLRYLKYLMARSASHGGASAKTLWNGVAWWLARNRLPASYWLFLFTSFFFDLGFSIYYFLFNLFLAGHDYNERALGQFAGAMAIGNLLGAFPAASLIRRFGLRYVILSCFVVAALVASTRALLLSFPWQIALAFFAGFTLSAWAVCIPPTVARLSDEKQRPRAFSLLFSLGIGTGAIGGIIGSRCPSLLGHAFPHLTAMESQQAVLIASCLLVAVGILPASRLKLDSASPGVTHASPFSVSPFLLRFLPAIAVWAFVTGSFSPLATVYLAKEVRLSLHQIGNVFSLSQAVQVIAVILAPLLFRRTGLIYGILLTQIAAAASLMILSSSTAPALAILTYIFFCAFQWMNEPGIYSLLMNAVPLEDRGSAAASNSVITSAAQAFASTLFGSFVVSYGYSSSIRAVGVVALAAAAMFGNLQRRKAAQPESSVVTN